MSTTVLTEAGDDILTEAGDTLITEADDTVTTGTADFPEVRLQWSPFTGPDDDPTWEDLTTYWVDAQTSRGRNHELDRFETGSASFTLKTSSRLFDQENTAGTYYGYLTPMRQIRALATWMSVDYPLFYGYITDYGQTTPDDVLFTTTLTCEDGFARLNQMTIDFSAWSQEVEADAPNVWYRFDDATTLIDASGNDQHGYWAGTPVLESGAPAGDSSMALSCDGNFTARGFHTVSFATVGHTFEFWLNTTATDGTIMVAGASGYRTLIYMVSGKLRFWDSGSSFFYETVDTFNDGENHHVVFAGVAVVYVDGVAVSTTTTGPTTPAQISSGGIANDEIWLSNDRIHDDGYVGMLDEFAIYDTTLSAARVAAHYTAGTTPWFGDLTGVRMGRILDAVDWPLALRDVADGISTIGDFTGQGSTVLDYLQSLADTETGLFYMDADGKIVSRDRHYLYTNSRATAVQATFGDGHSSEPLVFTDIAMPRDEALIRNPVTASRDGGVSVTATDTTFLATYGQRNWSAPASLDSSDNVIRDRSYWLLARYKDEHTRVAGSSFVPRSIVALWPVLLGLEFGDRTEWKRTALGLNSQTVLDQYVERVTHTFSPLVWTTNVVGSPVDSTAWAICDTALADSFVAAY